MKQNLKVDFEDCLLMLEEDIQGIVQKFVFVFAAVLLRKLVWKRLECVEAVI